MAFNYPVVNPRVTQHFGTNPQANIQPWGHYGTDFACDLDQPLYAFADGVIAWAAPSSQMGANRYNMLPGNGNSGNQIILDADGGVYSGLYAHLNRFAVNAGQRVKAGQIIGYAGNTGYSFGVHLHFELLYMPNINGYMYGRVDPLKYMSLPPAAARAVEKNQRWVGPANANQRIEPKNTAAIVRVIPANTLETFEGFVRGQTVSLGGVTSEIWYKDSEGYVWSGLFTSQSTDGLKDLVPQLKPNERLVGNSVVFQRSEPRVANGNVVREIQPNTREVFSGFVRGEVIQNNAIWFADKSGYAWSGAFVDSSVKGLPDLTPNPLVRKIMSTANANLRSTPFVTDNSNVISSLSADHEFAITGYVKGDKVGDSDIWFHRKPEGYIHLSAVTDGSLDGLKMETTPTRPSAPSPPPPVKNPDPVNVLPEYATKRLIAFPVNFRREPVIEDNVIGTLDISADVSISGWANAYDVNGSKIWFQVAPGNGWIHSSMVTDSSIGKIPEIKLTIDVPEAYNFTKDFVFAEYFPVHTSNMQDGNFPSKPTHVVLHQFNARELKPGIDGVISHFQTIRPGQESSAHFAVSEDRIVQLVGLKDRAFHAGKIGNDYIGIELDPDQDSKTVASAKKLLSAIRDKYGYLPVYIEHKDVPGNNTTCGVDIDLDLYRLDATAPAPKPVVVAPKPTPEVTTPTPEPTKPSPNVVTESQKKEVIREFLEDLLTDYLK